MLCVARCVLNVRSVVQRSSSLYRKSRDLLPRQGAGLRCVYYSVKKMSSQVMATDMECELAPLRKCVQEQVCCYIKGPPLAVSLK